MDKEIIQRLIDRFNAGAATDTDRREIERLLEAGSINVEDLEDCSLLEEQILRLEGPTPPPSLDRRFYEMVSVEKKKLRTSSWRNFFTWTELAPKIAIASVMLVVGVLAGYLLRSPHTATPDEQIAQLSEQVSDLQEMMMLSLLEKGSATDRLKAVNLTSEMSEASKKVTSALIQTLNQDENVNVRLAALDALKPYAADNSVREALIRSIGQQESPLVQISLAELMVALQETSAVKEMEKIVQSDRTPAEVKKKIKESIDFLI